MERLEYIKRLKRNRTIYAVLSILLATNFVYACKVSASNIINGNHLLQYLANLGVVLITGPTIGFCAVNIKNNSRNLKRYKLVEQTKVLIAGDREARESGYSYQKVR